MLAIVLVLGLALPQARSYGNDFCWHDDGSDVAFFASLCGGRDGGTEGRRDVGRETRGEVRW